MNDPHPEIIDIEIDHENLCKYLRQTWLKVWVLTLSTLGAGFGLIAGIERIENGEFDGIPAILVELAIGVLTGTIIAAIIALFLYLLLSHFKAKKISEAQQLRVEGAYLRIIQSRLGSIIDQKIHFRAVTDFSTIENPRMKKFGIKTLQMNTSGGGPAGLIRIDGIIDCDKVRDMLADIDRLRENEKH